MKCQAFAASAIALLAACAPTEPAVVVPAPVVVAPVTDMTNPLFYPAYMQMAASSDQFEIQSGQLALQMSQNPAVRDFANMLIQHHQQTSAQMLTAAQSAGLPPPAPAMTGRHAQMLANLRAAPPGTFDVAFRDAQIAAHQEALALHQNYASGGDVPALRAVAAQAVPVIQGHLNTAQSLQVTAAPMATPVGAGERG